MMKQAGLLFLLIVALAFASCGSDDLRIDGYDNFDYELERLKEKLK